MTITKQQFQALWSAFKKGRAQLGHGSRMGGAKRRMIERMIIAGSLTRQWTITPKGMDALHEACRVRYAKSGCMAYQQDLEEIERVLRTK